jgi:hypothetical protein
MMCAMAQSGELERFWDSLVVDYLEKVKDFSFILKKTEEMSRYMRAQGKQEATPRINASPSHNNDWANPGMDKRTMVKSFDLMLMTF